MNCIKSLVIVAAVLVGHACAQTPAKSAPQTPPPAAAASVAHVDTTVHVAGGAPRPLEQVMEALRLKYGWALDYEDPQYLYGKDVTQAKGSLWPAGAPFSVEIPAAPSADAPAEDKFLQAVVDAYNRSGNPGQFELRKGDAGAFSVVGVAARDAKEVVSPQKPLLDSLITVPAVQRTIIDSVNLICQVLTDETHVPVSVGVTPRNLVDRTNVTVGGSKVSARTLLTQALAASKHPLYWQFLFDPDSKSYLLNVHSLHSAKAPAPETPAKPQSPEVPPSAPKK